MLKDQRPGHLAESDFAALLLELEFPSSNVTFPLSTLRHLKNHLAECEECAQKLKLLRLERNETSPPERQVATERPKGCPDEEGWIDIASGVAPKDRVEDCIAHANQCPYCRPLFQLAQSELLDDASVAEEETLGSLSSSSYTWQSRLASRLIDRKRVIQGGTSSRPQDRANFALRVIPGNSKKQTPSSWRRPVLFATALLLVAIAVGWMVFRLRTQPSPETMIAQAYAERRTIEMRIAGAAHSQVRIERGSGQSSLERPQALLKAELTIADKLRKSPNDADVLDAKARADLIDGNYAAAIESLERARETRPNSQALLTDLATAFFLKAESKEEAIDYGQSIEYLSHVLQSNPNDPVALFNRAIAEERLHLFDGAKQDWKHYLEVETDPAWRAEGQQRYDALAKRSMLHHHADGNHVLDVGSIVDRIQRSDQQPFDRNKPGSGADEAFLIDAISRWLPDMLAQDHNSAITEPHSHSATSVKMKQLGYRDAINLLSQRLQRDHQDPWLRDICAYPHTQDWEAAITELALATQANMNGDLAKISPHADQAIKLFHKAGNRAGELAAGYQYLSGINRLQMGDRCLSVSVNALARMPKNQYPWLETKTLFEIATCDFMAGKPESALDYAGQARSIAEHAHYTALMLEADYFLDGVSTPWVARLDAWDRIGKSLTQFWNSDLPLRSAQGFYSDLGLAAESQGMWNCAETIFRESAAMHASDSDQYIVAASHHVLAQAAEAAGDNSVAEKEYRDASERLLHWNGNTGGKKAEFEIERAALEIKLGKLQIASDRLNAIKTSLPPITNHYINIPYLESLGELHFHLGQYTDAETELLTAVGLIEQDKASLTTETDFLTWQRDSSRAYRSLLQLYLQGMKDDRKAFALLEWYRAGPVRLIQDPGYVVKKQGTFSLHKVESFARSISDTKLSNQPPILTWVVLPGTLWLMLWDHNGLHSASVPVTEDLLFTTSARLTRLCRDPQSDRKALDQDAQQMYKWLVQPLSALLQDSKSLVIEPDDRLGPIPYQVLERLDGTYMGDLLNIVESPGMGYARILRAERNITSAATLLAVGNPQVGNRFGETFRPLPDATREVTSIAARFDSPYLVTGRQANLGEITHILNRAQIFHFAGHSFAGGGESGLILATSEGSNKNVSLGLEQFPREKLAKLQLVVLSGCETGTADQGLVDPQSLVRIFLRGGVPNVIASKWKVDSRVSAALMDSFYSHLLKGERVSAALTIAERSLRADPATSHPYYWAAFSVFGG